MSRSPPMRILFRRNKPGLTDEDRYHTDAQQAPPLLASHIAERVAEHSLNRTRYALLGTDRWTSYERVRTRR